MIDELRAYSYHLNLFIPLSKSLLYISFVFFGNDIIAWAKADRSKNKATMMPKGKSNKSFISTTNDWVVVSNLKKNWVIVDFITRVSTDLSFTYDQVENFINVFLYAIVGIIIVTNIIDLISLYFKKIRYLK